MGKQYSVYIKDEEMVEWIDEVSDNVFDSDAQTFRKAIEVMQEERGEEIRSLVIEDEDRTIL